MILVDELHRCNAPWGGDASCHLTSDESVAELLDFAKHLGIPLRWFQPRATIPHFDLAPSWRRRAIAAGAREVDRRGAVEALHRFRARQSAEAAG